MASRATNRIRVVSNENVVKNAHIFYLPDEGQLFDKEGAAVSEVEISNCITGVDLHLHVGEISRATLHAILVDARVDAAEAEAVVKHLRRRRFWMLRCRWERLTWRVKSRIKRRIARSLRVELQRELLAQARRDRF